GRRRPVCPCERGERAVPVRGGRRAVAAPTRRRGGVRPPAPPGRSRPSPSAPRRALLSLLQPPGPGCRRPHWVEGSAFRGGPSANISPTGLDRKGEEPDGREHEGALVRRAQDGDRDAFGELYRIHLPAVARLVRFRVGHDDEDAVSEVFLRAWRGLASYRDTGVPFAAWLYGIARHVAIDELRRQGRLEARDD